jgi:two-component system chemotaxis sensor kinase CheA
MVVPETVDDVALLNILCASGFSTREDADRAAGRGVGMAVVLETVRDLGGSLSVETELGRGTCFTMRLPLTLAIAEAFIVSTGEQTCAIPQSFVREVMHVQPEEIKTVNRVEIIPYRTGVLPITRLSTLFRLPASMKPPLSLLVLTSDRGSCGLVVDRIHGQKEVVVRSIHDPLINSPVIAGATELGDGRPVLILNAAVLTSGPVKPHEIQPDETAELLHE